VVIFNEKLAEVAQKFVRKGSKVYVEGQLATRKWTDQSGQERYTTEVVIPRFGGALTMLDGRAGAAVKPAPARRRYESGDVRRRRWRQPPGVACWKGRTRRRHPVLAMVEIEHLTADHAVVRRFQRG